jgi:hypothetical protein
MVPQPMVKSKKKEKLVRAIYEYKAEHTDELNLQPG